MAETPSPELLRLAARAGIVAQYHDIWGRHHAASAECLVALLRQQGIDASSAQAIEAAQRALDARHASRVLPPVLAVTAGAQRWRLPLRLPQDVPASSLLRWSLREEGGGEQHGEIDLRTHGEPRLDSGECSVEIRAALPPGYHRLRLPEFEDRGGQTLVIAAPERCDLPHALDTGADAADAGRIWGPALQLYALRSEHNWGMGDFGDLAVVIEQWAARGAGIVGLNPLHALFTHNPAHASPYSPSSRLRLNVLYIDVDAVEDLAQCEAARTLRRSAGFQQRLAALRARDDVDYVGVATAKLEVLRLLHASFRARHLQRDDGAATSDDDARARDFRAFRAEQGQALHDHATFEALQACLHAADPGVWGWPVWPQAYRDPRGDAVREFATAHAAEIEFHEYLQWLADRQLGRLAQRCRELGMAVGLYLDLAVSVDGAGSDTWRHQDAYATQASIGAPPDDFNLAGQNWGLPPLAPDRLRESAHALFIAALRASMRHAGALRIDHVMALMRLFWIPPGGSAAEGAYVHYAFDELAAIVRLESHRHRCVVIGEDLGTVADEVRRTMAATRMLSYRLLYFERNAGGDFKPPADYPRDALVAVSTHDLPTLAGWWLGRDLALRESLGLFTDRAALDAQRAERARDRERLLLALQREGLLAAHDGDDTTLTPDLLNAVHAFVARTPCRVMMLQLDDALGVIEQANVPGTTHEHPNWRRKLPLDLHDIARDPTVGRLAGTLARIRPRATPQPAAAAPHPAAEVPRATYRLQFHAGFTFDDALALLPYLQRLGISHVYCSPIMRARPGSRHGYDVVAPGQINPELGGRDGFERFCAGLAAHGMGQILDMVPNHMGIGGDNAWWQDVLEHGEASAYAHWFDIDWHPGDAALDGKVLLPVLGGHYGDVLERGELRLAWDAAAGTFALRYFDHRFPLDPRSYGAVLERAAATLHEGEDRESLAALAADIAALPAREQARCKSSLAALAAARPAVQGAIEQTLAALNSADGTDALDALLDAQAWRLAYWRVAADAINYRRFFDINELAALRIEDAAVFEATQGLALDLCAQGRADGLRIDHPDGLYDPAQYFRRLQEGYARRAHRPPPLPGTAADEQPLYVVVEKIAAAFEAVPLAWPVHGTTGYRFAMVAGGVLVDAQARERFDRIWRRFSGEARDFETLAWECKREVMRTALASELAMLSSELQRIARADRRTRDHGAGALREALAAVAACLPVYRTYLDDDGPSAQDRRFIDWAVARAKKRAAAGTEAPVFDFVRRVLSGGMTAPDARPDARTKDADDLHARMLRLARRFQQFTAPVAAKGVEDTAFYRYSRLVCLNEVGGDPATFGVTLRAFHGASADRAAHRSRTILATSTHDNKRSEDVRNRIAVLSEMPAAWRLALRRWSALTRGWKTASDDGSAIPAPADEYLLYQTLLGTLPVGGLGDDSLEPYRERIQAYMQKAVREAKQRSSWLDPDTDYEAALDAFIAGLLGRTQANPALADVQALAERVAWFGALNSLTLVLLKLTSPGVPDLYQGNELMDLSLVDPDNRRPVDYALRARALDELQAIAAAPRKRLPARLAELLAAPHDGRLKLWFTWRLLQLRAQSPTLWREGGYTALTTTGRHADHVLAYVREYEDRAVVVVAGRLFAKLMQGDMTHAPIGPAWADTAIALPQTLVGEGVMFEDALSGARLAPRADGTLRLARVFATLPGAALVLNPRSHKSRSR